MCIAVAPAHRSQLKNYTSWLEKHNLPYRVLNTGDIIDEKYSMLILTGGADVGKQGEELRDTNDIGWFKQSYGKIPVLGICRGFQLANVVLGGILHTDLSDTPVKHTSSKKEIAGEPNPLLESSYHDIVYESKKLRVNSRHHQGINVIAEGLIPVAYCEDDKLIEMATGNNSVFVQWHPEREEIWGTEAETMISEWIKGHIKERIDVQRTALSNIASYFKSKGFSVVSEERIKKSINESYDSYFLTSLIERYPVLLKRVTDKKGKPAIRINKLNEL